MSSSGGERLLLEVGEEGVDLEARRLKDAPPELDQERAPFRQAMLAPFEEAPIWPEPSPGAKTALAGSERRSAQALSTRSLSGKYGRFATTRSSFSGHGSEQVTLHHVDTPTEPVAPDVHARQLDGRPTQIRRPDIRVRRSQRDRDCDRTGAAPDVRDRRGLGSKTRERPFNQALRRRSRRHHSPGSGQQLDAGKARLVENAVHTFVCIARGLGLTGRRRLGRRAGEPEVARATKSARREPARGGSRAPRSAVSHSVGGYGLLPTLVGAKRRAARAITTSSRDSTTMTRTVESPADRKST